MVCVVLLPCVRADRSPVAESPASSSPAGEGRTALAFAQPSAGGAQKEKGPVPTSKADSGSSAVQMRLLSVGTADALDGGGGVRSGGAEGGVVCLPRFEHSEGCGAQHHV